MPSAQINGNVVNLTVSASWGPLQLSMSLQRHHYRYCAAGAGAPINSLMYASVADTVVTSEALEVGTQIEAMLKNAKSYEVLFGKTLTVTSKRTYIVDNNGLAPKQPPNHFFVTGGGSVWAQMALNEYTAASSIRRVEEAIAAKQAKGDKNNYRDLKTVIQVRNSGGRDNPVIAAYAAAHVQLNAVPNADKNLTAVSSQPAIVSVARNYP